jgi:hypothetical protein
LTCKKKHVRTEETCIKNVSVEIYEKWSEMGVSYLTDSKDFNIYIGQINFGGEEYYKYACENDSLIIYRYSKDYFKKTINLIETKRYKIKELMELHKFDN